MKITDVTPEQLDNYTYNVDIDEPNLTNTLHPQASSSSSTTFSTHATSLVQPHGTLEDQPSHQEPPACPAGPR
jgi:hypothetical protein